MREGIADRRRWRAGQGAPRRRSLIHPSSFIFHPSTALVLAAVGAFLALELPLARLERKLGFAVETLQRPSVLMLLGLAVAYGGYRAWGPHPVWHPQYCAWLATMPWRRGKPLPLGPVTLALQDAVLFAATALLAYRLTGLEPLLLLQVFLGAYLAVSMVSLAMTGPRPFGYVLAFALGLAAQFARHAPLCMAILTATYLLAALGYWESWPQLPWHNRSGETILPRAATRATSDDLSLGWHYDRLGPRAPEPLIGQRDAILLALLAAWWLHSLSALGRNPASCLEANAFVVHAVALVAPVLRLWCYCEGYASPISLEGRLRLGTLIIPRHDQVLVAPFATLLAGFALPPLLARGHVPPLLAYQISLACALYCVLGLGPSMREWVLTGQYRARGRMKDGVEG